MRLKPITLKPNLKPVTLKPNLKPNLNPNFINTPMDCLKKFPQANTSAKEHIFAYTSNHGKVTIVDKTKLANSQVLSVKPVQAPPIFQVILIFFSVFNHCFFYPYFFFGCICHFEVSSHQEIV